MNIAALAANARRFARKELENPSTLADYLKRKLGRSVVARLTGIRNANIVTRWARGDLMPERTTIQKMRIAAEAFYILTDLLDSEESAADWFTGDNEHLQRMPVDVISLGDYSSVIAEAIAVAQITS